MSEVCPPQATMRLPAAVKPQVSFDRIIVAAAPG